MKKPLLTILAIAGSLTAAPMANAYSTSASKAAVEQPQRFEVKFETVGDAETWAQQRGAKLDSKAIVTTQKGPLIRIRKDQSVYNIVRSDGTTQPITLSRDDVKDLERFEVFAGSGW